MKNASIFKIAAIHFFMYFVGPIIWGAWMIFRLQIISVQQYVHCIASVPVLAMLLLYYVVNTVYMVRKTRQGTDNPENHLQHLANGKSVLLFNVVSVVSFGTIGTFAFLSMLATNSFASYRSKWERGIHQLS